MSFSEDAWLSTRNKTKIQIKPGPLKRRSSLPKRKPTQPSGIYTLTQTSPPPKELFTAKKQSKLSEFFGRKNGTSEIGPEQMGHCHEEQNENLEDGTNKGRYSNKSKDMVHIHLPESIIEQDSITERQTFPLTENKINGINILTAQNRGMKRILSDDVEENVSKRSKKDSKKTINGLDEGGVEMLNDSEDSQKCSFDINGHTQNIHDHEHNKQNDISLDGQKLYEVDKLTLSRDGTFEHHERTTKKRAEIIILENDSMCNICITEHRDKTVNQLKNDNSVSDNKVKSEIDNDFLEKRKDSLTGINNQLKKRGSTEHSESIKFGNYSKGVKNSNSLRRKDTATASHLSMESTANCSPTNVWKDHESDDKSTKDRIELENSLDLSESSYKYSLEESLNLETQTFRENIYLDGLYHEETQSQLNLSEESESSLQLCTQFSLSSS